MKNIVLFQKLSKVRKHQLRCAALLTAVPIFCSAVLTGMLFNFTHMNLFFLQNGGLILSDEITRAYFDQVQLELWDVVWFLLFLFVSTFGISYMLMGWAVSPFVNGERVLRSALANPEKLQEENDWLSESPTFHKVIWGLAQRLRDKKHVFDDMGKVVYRFNYRFFAKFVMSFFGVSLATGLVLGIVLSTVYTKIVSLAFALLKMKTQGHFFIAQEQMLKTGVELAIVLSCFVYVVIGYYVTTYMSNMMFVFTRAIKEHHFPLELRDSDVYHGLASAISDVASEAGLSKKK